MSGGYTKDGRPDNRGGPRPGSGRKPRFENSDKFLRQLVEAEEASVAKGEMSVAEYIIDLIKGGSDARTQAQMIKLFTDKIVVSASEHEVESVKHAAPGVLLPPEQPDRGLEPAPAEERKH